jgi:hypothetical protein
MNIYEYQILHADGFVAVPDLNELGKQRWELLIIMPVNDSDVSQGYYYIFKRSIPHPSVQMQMPMPNSVARAAPKQEELTEVFARGKV